jgi:hypothetical protein
METTSCADDFRREAHRRNAEVQFNSGFCLSKGEGFPVDLQKSQNTSGLPPIRITQVANSIMGFAWRKTKVLR